MMESVKQYLQDWSDACEYANECAPDLSFLAIGEPYTALASIAVVCFLIWAVNEWRIGSRPQSRPIAAARAEGESKAPAEKTEREAASHEKLAA